MATGSTFDYGADIELYKVLDPQIKNRIDLIHSSCFYYYCTGVSITLCPIFLLKLYRNCTQYYSNMIRVRYWNLTYHTYIKNWAGHSFGVIYQKLVQIFDWKGSRSRNTTAWAQDRASIKMIGIHINKNVIRQDPNPQVYSCLRSMVW